MQRGYKSRGCARILKKNTGFTLVEIVVAVLILAIGILGVAGMQSVGVRESQNTYFRSQANLLAADMAGKMRANAIEAKKGDSSVYIEDAPAGGGDCSSSCDSVAVAEADRKAWEDAISSSGLPNAGQSVNYVGGVNLDGELVAATYDIQIFWDEDREGAVATDCASASGCISWRVQI